MKLLVKIFVIIIYFSSKHPLSLELSFNKRFGVELYNKNDNSKTIFTFYKKKCLRVRPDALTCGYPQGQGQGQGQGYADPQEGRIRLRLRKIYLSTLVTRPSI